MRMKMTPMSWAGLLGVLLGLFYLIASGDETQARMSEEATQELQWGRKPAESAPTELAGRKKREVKPRSERVIFVDDPDELEFFDEQVEGKSEEARAMYQSWRKLRISREILREGGLGSRHPDIMTLADREVLLGNRLNQRLRNEGR